MFKQILVLVTVTVAVFSTAALADSTGMSERQFQECMRMSNDMTGMKRAQSRVGSNIEEVQRNLRSLDQKLANLDFQYEMADAAYRGCLSAGWGSCDQQARNLDHYANSYNSTLDTYNRLAREEDRLITKYNKQLRSWRNTEDTYNRRCIGVKVDKTVIEKYCSNSSNNYCKGFN